MIRTDRLQIEDIRIDDSAFMLALVNTEGWLRFVGDRQVRNLEDARRYIDKLLGTENLSYMVVRLQPEGTPIGIISFLKRSYLEHFDLGFAFLPAYMGKGYALEAARAVLDKVRQDPAHQVVLATTMPSNEASIQLLTRLGFRYTRTLETDGLQLLVYAFGQAGEEHIVRPPNNA